jgi:hypothetical protein
MPVLVECQRNESCAVQDPFGHPMPPYIVLEKGESLKERTRGIPIDVFTAAQVSPIVLVILITVSESLCGCASRTKHFGHHFQACMLSCIGNLSHFSAGLFQDTKQL